MAATAQSCRVSIRTADRDVDLTLPAHLPLRDLLPAVADVVAAETASDLAGRELRLSHPVSGPLDPAESLARSGIRDGDLLTLSEVRPVHRQPESDPCAAVAAAVTADQRPWREATSQAAAVFITWWATLTAAALLGRPVVAPQAGRHIAPTIAAGTLVLLAALIFQRRGAARPVVAGLALGACGFAALAGWLAVPGGPAVANAALAMSACAAAAAAASRVCDCAATVLVSLCGVSASAAVLTLGAVVQWWPVPAGGPILACCWLAVLAMAPRLAARTSRLSASDPVDEALRIRTLIAHRHLTTVVVTASSGAVLGCLLTALSTPRSPASVGFIAAVTATLLLRTLTHPEYYRSIALAIGAGLAATTLLGTAVSAEADLTAWLCAALAGVGAAGILLMSRPEWRLSAGSRKVLRAADFAAAVAVAPLGCWAIGVFAAVGDLSLP